MAKVLSLFDGMACGMIAMQLAGVEVESYDAYEIDKVTRNQKYRTPHEHCRSLSLMVEI